MTYDMEFKAFLNLAGPHFSRLLLCFYFFPIQIQVLGCSYTGLAPPYSNTSRLPLTTLLLARVLWHRLRLPNSYSSFGVRFRCHLLFATSPATSRQSTAALPCSHTFPPHVLNESKKHKCQALSLSIFNYLNSLNPHRSPIM